MLIGVLAFQGGFKEHLDVLKRLKLEAIEIRSQEELNKVDGLIIPGGESTVISEFLKNLIIPDIPIFGTCAGCIILSKFGLIDVEVQRNAYGSQLDSFEIKLDNGVNAVFIRAPRIVEVGKNVKILATLNNEPVLVKQGKILASTFHPELTEDLSVHKIFIDMI